jgi:two-component system, LytTR family, response regulator
VRVLIVDDEELARARLRRLLGAHPDVEIVADLGDPRRITPEHAVDVAFLDIRMPRRDGFEVAADLGDCVIIYVTAWSEHAVRAFDAGAVDYLMKPVDADRLALALGRARERLTTREPPPEAPVARLAVRDQGRLVFVDVAALDAVVAQGNYVELRAGTRTYTLRATLSAVQAKLEPGAFVRVHRSVLLRVARISAIEPLFHGEYLVTLADGSTFTSARGQRAELRKALGLSDSR